MNYAPRILALALTAVALPSLLQAGDCSSFSVRSPVVPAPEFGPNSVRLWGQLEPVDTGPLPSTRDSSARLDGFEFPNSSNPSFRDVDYAGGFVFTTAPYGFDYFDASTPSLERDPVKIGFRDGFAGHFAEWSVGGENLRMFLAGDAIENQGLIYIVNVGRRGVIVHSFDPGNLGQPPVLRYQDWSEANRDFTDVELIRGPDNRLYAYASGKAIGGGVQVYDISSAANLTGCLDDLSMNQRSCGVAEPGLISFGGLGAPFQLGAGDGLLAYGSFAGGHLYDTTANATNPTYLGTLEPTQFVEGIDVFANSSGQFGVVTRTGSTIKFYDITNCVVSVRGGGSCGSLGSPVLTVPYNSGSANEFVEALELGSTDFVYAFLGTGCQADAGDEQLYDVTNLQAINDIMPHATDVFVADGFTDRVGLTAYYSWARSATGFQASLASGGEIVGPYLYRAQNSFLDIFEIVDLEPTISITGPTQAYVGQSTTFTAVAANCDGSQTGTWTWTPTPQSTSGASADIVFSSTGVVNVSATNSACPGATVTPLSVTVLDPVPAIQAFRVNGTVVGAGQTFVDEICSLLSFSLDATGQPPLTYSWEILDATQATVASSASPTFPWDTSDLGMTTGAIYSAQVDLSNSSGSANTSRTIDLDDLPPLGFGQAGGHPVCGQTASACSSQSPPGTGNVSLYANSEGANAWKWEYRAQGSSGAWTLIADFGSGQEEDNVTLTLGDWEVRSTIRNCINETAESIFDVVVDQDDPVTADFTPVGCTFGCEFPAGSEVFFSDSSTGPITTYEYDFLHQGSSTSNCNFASPRATPQQTFTFSTPGSYRPCLRVSGAGSQDVALTDNTIVINAGNPPSVSVSCPASAGIGQNITCTASAQNCSPGATSWSWNTSGGSISGSANGSSISVSWSTAGSKSVNASNAQCGAASGTDVVNVTGGGGGGPLNANFTFTPTSPDVNDTVNLNASSTTGTVISYNWTVDPPGSGGNQTLTGVNPSFVALLAGDYRVILDVFSQVGCTNPSCQDSITKTITVAGAQPVTAAFTVNPTNPVVGQSVTINTASSTGPVVERLVDITSPGGGTTSYSGETAPTHVFTQTGLHTIELTVTNQAGCDDSDCMDTATSSVTVGVATAPVAALAITPNQPVIGEAMRLDSSGSTGPIVARTFTVRRPNGSEATLSGTAVDFVPTQTGLHTVTLEVETAVGCAATACQDTEVQTVEVLQFAPLIARYVVNPDPPRMGEVAVFSASPSGGNPTSFEWNIGGLALTGESVAVQLADMGDLSVSLTVRRAGDANNLTETIRVFGPCVADDLTLCVGEGRFRGTVHWETDGGQEGHGQVRPELTDASGMMWFFNPDNIEQLIKVLDGCSINGHYWVLAAALTDVGYDLLVEDLIAEQQYTFSNPIGTASPALVDTSALATCDASAAVTEVLAQQGRLATDREILALGAAIASRQAKIEAVSSPIGTCAEGPSQACFLDGRFRAEISFATQIGQTGLARVGVLDSANTGVFYFFDPLNLELVAKVIDGCGVNDHFWVFAAATTDQQYTLRITDTVSGQSREYHNPLGTVAPAVTDTEAFATCSAGG